MGLAFVLGFFLFSTSDPDSKVSGKENQRSEAEEAGDPSQKEVAGNEVEGERIHGHSLMIVWLGFTGKKAVLRGLAV